MPLVYIEIQIDALTHVSKLEGTRAPINQFVHYRKFPDASNKTVVGFNVDTLYSLAQLDVSKEPMVLSVPEMGDRFWVMQIIDGWNNVPHAPGSRSVGGKGGNFAIVGPDWKGTLPDRRDRAAGANEYCDGRADALTPAARTIMPPFMRSRTNTSWCRSPHMARTTRRQLMCR